MKTSILATAIVAAMWAPIASAQDDKPMPAKPAMNMDMGMGKPAQQPSTAGAPAMNMGTDKQDAATQANMDKMQRQMDKITTTTDPKMRQKLMEEHMQTMQENMKTMRGMGSAKMKDGQGGMTMGDKKEGMSGSDMQKRQDMSDMRMDMMQQMMEQMMERDKASKPMGHM